MTDLAPASTENPLAIPPASPDPVASEVPAGSASRASRPNVLPVLEQLAKWHPHLFGATFLPLKRGIFQDLLEAHPGELERPVLKAALAFHARSTRYLTAVSSGQMRHDLQGQAVEPVAPEHVYQALLEVFQRRQTRSAEDLRPKLVARIVHAFEVSGLSVQDYVEKMHGSDEGANALLQDAMAEVQSRAARDEALLRAFESSGTQSVEQFAEMYGMQVGAAHATLQRARSARPNP